MIKKKVDYIHHVYIRVNEDDKKANDFHGSLADYGAYRLSFLLATLDGMDGMRVINIESLLSTSEVRPKMSDPSTWYDRKNLTMSVWLATKTPGVHVPSAFGI